MKERRQVSDRTEVGKTRAEKSLTDRIKVAVPRGELAAWRDRKAKLSRVTERHLVFKGGTFSSLEGFEKRWH